MNEFQGVRIARPDEADAIYQLLLELHSENGLYKLDPAKARQTIVDLLDPAWGLVGVIDGQHGLEGSIGLFRAAWYYTSDPHLTEMWNFVRAECRRSEHAKRLIQFAIWSADCLKIPLHIGIVTTTRAEAKQRLYRRMLTQVGGYFMHGATPRLAEELSMNSARDVEQERALEEVFGAAKRVAHISEPGGNGRASVKNKTEATKLRQTAMDELKQVVAKAERTYTNGL